MSRQAGEEGRTTIRTYVRTYVAYTYKRIHQESEEDQQLFVAEMDASLCTRSCGRSFKQPQPRKERWLIVIVGSRVKKKKE